MANLKEVRNRIQSVNSTQQITKAMKMVSAAKLKRAVDASSNMVPFARNLQEMMGRIGPELGDIQNVYSEIREVKKVLVVVITSNRGLAGAFNSNIIRLAQNQIQEQYLKTIPKENILILAIGKKGFEYFKRRGYHVLENASDLFNNLRYSELVPLANRIMQGFVEKEWDSVELFYNRFKNAALQIQEQVHLIPVQKSENMSSSIALETSEKSLKNPGKIEANFIFEPDLETLVNYLIPESIRATLYSSLLSSFAAEHGARMTSMDKATENASELLKAYKLQYNRARQASITNEILEIVSGANALESSGS
jgi:F-type H+-transporting ATPase subunit gamma